MNKKYKKKGSEHTEQDMKDEKTIKKALSKTKGKMSNLKFVLIVIVLSVIIMASIFVTAFYIVVNNNVYGIGEKYRDKIEKIPLLKRALPEERDEFASIEHLTDEDVRSKYMELKMENDELEKKLLEANRLISELEVYKDSYEKIIIEKEKEDNLLLEERNKLESDRQSLQKLAAMGDKEGFKKYFETIDKETAAKIYNEILIEEKSNNEIDGFIKIYEGMDENAAAKILSDMGEENIEIVAKLLLDMNKESASAILGRMNTSFASKVTKKIAEITILE